MLPVDIIQISIKLSQFFRYKILDALFSVLAFQILMVYICFSAVFLTQLSNISKFQMAQLKLHLFLCGARTNLIRIEQIVGKLGH